MRHVNTTEAVELSWHRLEELACAYGHAFYLLDSDAFRRNYAEFLGAFRSIYPRSQIAYSYKTNYAPALCRIVESMGGYAEVVSELEYELAVRVGVPPERIVFNGPCKREAALERALLAGAIVNLDSMHEVGMAAAVAARRADRPIRVGLRCNFELEAAHASRFGLDVESGDLREAVRRLRHTDNCIIDGLHCHFSTAHKSAASYASRTSRMVALAREIFGSTPPRFIDVGGGFFGRMNDELRAQFPVEIPHYRDYAAAIAACLARAYPGGDGPELILEPGTGLVGDVMRFAARVVAVKQVRGRAFAMSAGSIYDIKPTLHQKNLPMRVLRRDGLHEAPAACVAVDVVGDTCMEHDYLYRGYDGPIEPGDYTLFDNVGAYSVVLRPPFIRPCPPIVACAAGSRESALVKRGSTFEDVFAGFGI